MQFSLMQLGDILTLGYVGPGAGLTAFGALIAIIAAAALLAVGFIWYPLRRMLRAMKNKSGEVSEPQDAGTEHQPTATDDGGKNG